MNNQLDYETPICNLRRLVSEDKSDKFKLIITFKNLKNISNLQDQKKTNSNELEIDTTINKARAISSKINKMINKKHFSKKSIFYLDQKKTITKSNLNFQMKKKPFHIYAQKCT